VPDVIRATRETFSVGEKALAFAIRTAQVPGWYEVTVATDPLLFDPARRPQRTLRNFFSSHVAGRLQAKNGSVLFLLPEEVIRRFLPQPRLYYTMVTFPSLIGGSATVVFRPQAKGPFVNLKGDRGALRAAASDTPARGDTAALIWAGDNLPAEDALRPRAASSSSSNAFPPMSWPAESHVIANVPLIAQRHGMSAWAAAALMLSAWRSGMKHEHGDVVSRWGHWAGHLPHGVRATELQTLADAWKLELEPPAIFTPRDLIARLREFGPLWVGQSAANAHAVVVTGVTTQGSVENTKVHINNPRPTDVGEIGVMTWLDFIRRFSHSADLTEALQQPTLTAQLIHVARTDEKANAKAKAEITAPVTRAKAQASSRRVRGTRARKA